MKGDTLASGGRSAQFGGPSGVSQEKWDAIWAEEEKIIKEAEATSGQVPAGTGDGKPLQS